MLRPTAFLLVYLSSSALAADRFCFSAGPAFGLSDGRNAAGQGMVAEMAWPIGTYDLGVHVETMHFNIAKDDADTDGSARTRVLMFRVHRLILDTPVTLEAGAGAGTVDAAGASWTIAPIDIGAGLLVLRRDGPNRSASLEVALFYRYLLMNNAPTELDANRLGGLGLVLRGIFRF